MSIRTECSADGTDDDANYIDTLTSPNTPNTSPPPMQSRTPSFQLPPDLIVEASSSADDACCRNNSSSGDDDTGKAATNEDTIHLRVNVPQTRTLSAPSVLEVPRSKTRTAGGTYQEYRNSLEDSPVYEHRDQARNDECYILPWQPSMSGRSMYEGADMPYRDVAEDYVGTEPLLLKFNVAKLPVIRGYEGIDNYGTDIGPLLPPPSYYRSPGVQKPLRQEELYSSVTFISEEQAIDALVEFVSQKCCYGRKPTENMNITKMETASIFKYALESFTEVRSASWEQEPYRGQPIEAANVVNAPGPWDIECEARDIFQNEVHHIEVPRTAVVKNCQACCCLGWLRCYGCLGRGFKRCSACQGSGRDWKTDNLGHRHPETCLPCSGSGRKGCSTCGCDGRVSCRTCDGYGQMKFYIRLTVIFSNIVSEITVDPSRLPQNLTKSMTGKAIFEQKMQRLWPISCYPDTEVCQASQVLIREHSSKCYEARLICQRHRLCAIPVVDCAYTWKSKEKHFCVYGAENLLYLPDYPQQYLRGCIIL